MRAFDDEAAADAYTNQLEDTDVDALPLDRRTRGLPGRSPRVRQRDRDCRVPV